MTFYSVKNTHDTAANWTSNDPTLLVGEFGYETDTGKLKIGDGSTAWTGLAYFSGSGSGMVDPMTTRGDIIYKNASGVTTRLGVGTNGQVLTTDGTDLSYENPSADFADPMTTIGDMIYRDGSNDTAKLAIGTANQVLTSNGTNMTWETPASGGYTNLTQFVDQTAWRLFYSNTDGDVVELALGTDGTFLKSNGASAAPSFAVPAGSGDVSKDGTPVNNQVGVWTGDGTIEGTSSLTYDGTTFGVTGAITVTEALSVASDKKLNLEGSAGNSYFIYNSSLGKVELFVNGVKKADW